MNRFINHNGIILKSDEPVLHAGNRAFKFGDGLFETMKIIDGRVVFLRDHLDRLSAGMNLLGLKLNRLITTEGVQYEVTRLLNKNQLKNAHVRFSVYRSGAGKYTPESDDFEYLITAEEGTPEYKLNEQGLQIGLYRDHKKPINEFGLLKSSNALLYVLASRNKKLTGCDEMILLNEKGELCEGTNSNLFLMADKKLYAPGRASGCVTGVMRKQVIDIALKGGIEVVDKGVPPELLNKADEVFFTNATTGVRWALAYKSRRYFNKFTSQLVGYLNGRAFEEVNG